MKIILFGATGMVGQGVLREALHDPDVERVLVIGRSDSGARHDKLTTIVRADLFDLSPLERELTGYDACLFCLGVSSAGMTEADYRHITFDLTLAVARTLARLAPTMKFIYVSGSGTDSTARGRSMWARVKGETENALLEIPFAGAYMFRPGFIQPQHGITSKTKLYRAVYAMMGPLYPILKAFPRYVTSTETLGRAMMAVAKEGAGTKILESDAINALGASAR